MKGKRMHETIRRAAAGLTALILTVPAWAAGGDKAAVQKAFGATGETCKACHDKYRME